MNHKFEWHGPRAKKLDVANEGSMFPHALRNPLYKTDRIGPLEHPGDERQFINRHVYNDLLRWERARKYVLSLHLFTLQSRQHSSARHTSPAQVATIAHFPFPQLSLKGSVHECLKFSRRSLHHQHYDGSWFRNTVVSWWLTYICRSWASIACFLRFDHYLRWTGLTLDFRLPLQPGMGLIFFW